MDDENINNDSANENPENAPADSGLDVSELKSMIANLNAQVESLTNELKKKEPDVVDRTKEIDAYFLNLMKGVK